MLGTNSWKHPSHIMSLVNECSNVVCVHTCIIESTSVCTWSLWCLWIGLAWFCKPWFLLQGFNLKGHGHYFYHIASYYDKLFYASLFCVGFFPRLFLTFLSIYVLSTGTWWGSGGANPWHGFYHPQQEFSAWLALFYIFFPCLSQSLYWYPLLMAAALLI